MPRIDASREQDIRREVRIAMATDPLISTGRLQRVLYDKGFMSTSGGMLDNEFILRMVRKINGEAKREVATEEVAERMIETRNRFKVIFERLFKIAFWKWDYLNDGIPMPELKEQIKAMDTIMKMDIALIQAEMDAGIFERKLGTLEVNKRNLPISEERKKAILVAMENWNLLSPENVNNAESTTEPARSE